MVNYDKALDTAIRRMNEDCIDPDIEPQIVEEETLSNDLGWVFFYQNRKFLESGNWADALAGNAPILVNMSTGECVTLGTARPVEAYLADYRTLGYVAGP